MSAFSRYFALLLLCTQAAVAATPFAELACPVMAAPEECVQFLLKGQPEAAYKLRSNGKLWVRLYADSPHLPDDYHQVDVYDKKRHETAIHLMIPKRGGDAMVGQIEAIKAATGNQVLEILEQLYGVLHIKRAWLTDMSSVQDERVGYLMLRLHGVVTRSDQSGWYERHGYAPMIPTDFLDQLQHFTDSQERMQQFVHRLYGPGASTSMYLLESDETSPELYALAKKVVRSAKIGGLLQDLPEVPADHRGVEVLRSVGYDYPSDAHLSEVIPQLDSDRFAAIWDHLIDVENMPDSALGEFYLDQALAYGDHKRIQLLSHWAIQGLFQSCLYDYEYESRAVDAFVAHMEALLSDSASDTESVIELDDEAAAWFGPVLQETTLRKAFNALTTADRERLVSLTPTEREQYWLHVMRLPYPALSDQIAELLEESEEPDLFALQLALSMVRLKQHFVWSVNV